MKKSKHIKDFKLKKIYKYKSGYCECGKKTTKKIDGKYICNSCFKMKSLDSKLEERNLVIGDIHIPYQDDKAIKCVLDYSRKYKPDRIIINGDLIDFYTLSVFDKCPERKDSLQDEIDKTKVFLNKLRRGYKGEIVYLQGNHENRLQRFLWNNPVLVSVNALSTENLFELKKNNIKEVKVNGDYWSAESGEYQIGDLTIQHGDGRLNGAKYSQNPGYAAFNTLKMKGGNNVVMGHTHRLAMLYNRVGDKSIVGVEGGCLCQTTRGNWQQGFVTFKSKGKLTYDYEIHRIVNGNLS
jgi:predicted phosphodiesterase